MKSIDRMSQLSKPPYASIYGRFADAFSLIGEQQSDMIRFVEDQFAGVVAKQMMASNKAVQVILAQMTAATHVGPDPAHPDRTWLDAALGSQEVMTRLHATLADSVSGMARYLIDSQRVYARLDLSRIRAVPAIPTLTLTRMERCMVDQISCYARVSARIRDLPDLVRIPATTIVGTPREVFVAAHAVDALAVWQQTARVSPVPGSVARAEQEVSGCVALLERVNPALVRPYVGAQEALKSGNPDKVRHVLVSLRELIGHLLRSLGPDKAVVAWIPAGAEKLLDDKGRPTRKARVLYICRNVQNEPLSDFVRADTAAAVALIGLYDRLHELEASLTPEQLRALMLRTTSFIVYIIQLATGD